LQVDVVEDLRALRDSLARHALDLVRATAFVQAATERFTGCAFERLLQGIDKQSVQLVRIVLHLAIHILPLESLGG
jgi:hypothetical protein